MNTRIYAAIAAALSCAAVSAQSLSTEVVVDRTVLPAERAASRPAGVTPALVLPAAKTIDLATADYTTLSPLTRGYTALSPVEAPLLTPVSPYRGYAVLGYGPMYNLGLSAGYRAINTDRMRLGIHAQFDGESYGHHLLDYADDAKFSYNGGRLGADFNMSVGASSHLLADVSAGYSRMATPDFEPRSLVDGRIGLMWLSTAGRISYKAGASVDFDSYGELTQRRHDLTYGKLGSQRYSFELGAAASLSSVSRAGVDVEGSFLHSSGLDDFTPAIEAVTQGVVGITPHYTLRSGIVNATVGLTVDIAAGHESQVNIIPRLNVAVEAAPQVALYARITGGSTVNDYAMWRQMSPYFSPILPQAGELSDVPFDGEIGLNIGSIGGFTGRLFGGYSIARDWFMADGSCGDVKGWHAGIELGYSLRRIGRVSVSAQAAPSDADKGYYLWRDHARYVLGGRIDLTPVERLSVGVGYEFRGHRTGLRSCVSDLSASASYGITDAVSVFARVENLLSRRYEVISGVESQGARGMIGVSVKF